MIGSSPITPHVTMAAPKPNLKRTSFLRHTTALFLVLAGGISMVLFSVKYQVHDLEAAHQRLVQELDDERRALHVLRAEWANLNDPVRIQKLAEQYLGMQPVMPAQVMSVTDVQNFPKHIKDPVVKGSALNEAQ